MSTHYFLVCDKHKELMFAATNRGSHTAGGADAILGPFVYAHRDCSIRIADEFDPSIDAYVEWDDETLPAMHDKRRNGQ